MVPPEPTPADALRALRARGVNRPQALLECGTSAEILAACHRWDRERNVQPGLLVHWIHAQEFEDEPPLEGKAAQHRARFKEYARLFPVGSVVESHAALFTRRWPDDIERAVELGDDVCDGDMVVVAASYPVLEMECNACGFAAGVGPRHLHVLGGRS